MSENTTPEQVAAEALEALPPTVLGSPIYDGNYPAAAAAIVAALREHGHLVEQAGKVREELRLRTLGHNAAAHYAYEVQTQRDEARAALARVEALCDRWASSGCDSGDYDHSYGCASCMSVDLAAAISPAPQQDRSATA